VDGGGRVDRRGRLHGPVKHGNGRPPVKKHSPGSAHRNGNESRNSRAPERTFEEVRYLRRLIDNVVPVRIRLRDNEEVSGTLEYYDQAFVRLTREGAENLFIFKHDIKYLYEE